MHAFQSISLKPRVVIIFPVNQCRTVNRNICFYNVEKWIEFFAPKITFNQYVRAVVTQANHWILMRRVVGQTSTLELLQMKI